MESTRRVTEKLTQSEVNRLRKMIDGYGRLQAAHDQVSTMHLHTLRNIAETGRGIKSNIDLIRATLLNQGK